MQNKTDSQLIEDYLKGDQASLEILIKRYLKPIYGFCFSYVKDAQTAEDVTQEVFLRVWRNLKKFDRERNFKPWIFAIAKNASFDSLKKKKAVLFSDIAAENSDFADQIPDRRPLADSVAELAGQKLAFVQGLEKLSQKYAKILSLYYQEYLNFREISELLHEPINTVKSRHRRGLIMLRNIINQNPR